MKRSKLPSANRNLADPQASQQSSTLQLTEFLDNEFEDDHKEKTVLLARGEAKYEEGRPLGESLNIKADVMRPTIPGLIHPALQVMMEDPCEQIPPVVMGKYNVETERQLSESKTDAPKAELLGEPESRPRTSNCHDFTLNERHEQDEREGYKRIVAIYYEIDQGHCQGKASLSPKDKISDYLWLGMRDGCQAVLEEALARFGMDSDLPSYNMYIFFQEQYFFVARTQWPLRICKDIGKIGREPRFVVKRHCDHDRDWKRNVRICLPAQAVSGIAL